MAIQQGTLSSTAARTKVGKYLVEVAEQNSHFGIFKGERPGPGVMTVVSNDVGIVTFRTEGVSGIVGNVVPSGAPLTGNLSSQFYQTYEHNRRSHGQAAELTKLFDSQNPHDNYAIAAEALGFWWARMYDFNFALHASAQALPTFDTATAGAFQNDVNASHTDNITLFKTVVDAASAGRGTSTAYNIWYAGTISGNPILTVSANTYTNEILANPTDHILTPQDFRYLYAYMADRGIMPLTVETSMGRRQTYVAFVPPITITELQSDPEYLNARDAGVEVFGNELYSGKMRYDMIHGITLIPTAHPGTNMINSTPLRTETATGDSNYVAVESLVFGQCAMAESAYDDFEVIEATENDFNRSRKIGVDIIKGWGAQTRNVTADGSTDYDRRNVCSLVHTTLDIMGV